LFFGIAIANVVRGVPLDDRGYFFEPLGSDFYPRNATPGVLDWCTVLVGLLGLATLNVRGANYMALKTDGPFMSVPAD
jgi:cytochrome d ubiquinol oxidase subunit II